MPSSAASIRVLLLGLLLLLPGASTSLRADAMLQFFNTSWNDISQKMPELAEAGYTSIWIPPPTKAGSGLSVGYDLFDPFDLGDNESGQAGSNSTNYGTTADLLNLVTVAHRFGIRVYIDNVCNHRGFSVPGYDAYTSINYYPGTVPEDFHLLTTPAGFYRNVNSINFNDSWSVVYDSLEGLCDLANEPGTTNLNFGTEGSSFPKISFVRTPTRPDFYCYKPDGTYVGFGPNNGITTAMIQANPSFYSEYIQDYQSRSVRWLIDTTKCDGIRLDAVKSVRDDFFGAEYGSDMNQSTYGYCGQIQLQYDLTHNVNPSNLRASNFDTEIPRTNAIIFGEHLGAPPPQDPYINAGMRLLDNDLSGTLSGDLPYGPLTGLDQPGGGGLPEGQNCTVAYVQSADYGYAAKQKLQYAFVLARQGLPVVYTDGFNYAPILGSDGKAFPANSYNDFLGQYNDPSLTSMVYVHDHFSRSNQIPIWSDSQVVGFERQDKRENTSMSDADGTVLLFMMNGNGSAGQSRGMTTHFPAGAYLWQYARGTTDAGDQMTGFYYTVPSNQQVGDLIIPKDGYFAFSWRSPENSSLTSASPITILQNGQPTPTVTYMRKDGANGDPNFNPYGVSGAVAGSYEYPWTVPCVTSPNNLSFIARADGSAENMLMKLDGGVDVNSQMGLGPQTGELRDNPPAVATDVFLGYEQMQFVDRQNPELFAAVNTQQNQIGSLGAETYVTKIGSGTFTENAAGGTNPNDTDGTLATFVYHDPTQPVGLTVNGTTPKQYTETAGGVNLWVKTNSVGAGFKVFVYYTTDGTYPEGAGGVGTGSTQVMQMSYYGNDSGGNNWWNGTISPLPTGTLTYKIGVYSDAANGSPVASVFPSGPSQVAQKLNMMTTFQITNFNAATALVYPHNDYGVTQTGLSQGFHVVRVREFLNRANPTRASIYNTVTQTFYYDTQLPQGQIVFPSPGNTLTQSQYGVVVRTDQSVTSVEYNIQDSNPNNDDSVTTVANGNNAWVQATELPANPAVVSSYPNEWRFNYVNIPSSGTATIQVRLKKLTSSSNDTLTDTAGHYTTLTCNVNTSAPAQNMFFAYPTTDGQTVGSNYIMKVWFSPSLLSSGTATFIANTVVNISSSESGSAANPVAQPKTGMTVDAYNVGPGGQYDELAFPIPNLYNGSPNFEFTVAVTTTVPGGNGLTLTATRLIKATPVPVVLDTILTPPAVDANGNPYQTILPAVVNPTAAQRSIPIVVQTDANASSVVLNFTSGPTVSSSNVVLTGTTTVGSDIDWTFAWNNVAQGSYTFNAAVTEANGTGTTTQGAADVLYRELVTTTTGKLDNDDDGIPDAIETGTVALPSGNPDLWTDDQVHRWVIANATNALSPDTDGDGLPDGLELGLAVPMALSSTQAADTNTMTSTNGQTPNFQPDLDPPIYNTDDNQNWPTGQNYSYYGTWPFNENNSRTDQIAGTMTSPIKAETDDGISDGLADLCYGVVTGANNQPVLDANGHIQYYPVHKGRVDIIPDVTGTQTAIEHPPTIYNSSTINRAAVLAISPNAQWLETDPNNQDTTTCGMSDSAKDVNGNGIVDLAIIDRNKTDANGNYVVLATMSNPLTPVTVQGSAAGSTKQTFYYLDWCFPYIEPNATLPYFVNAQNVTNALAGGGAASANTSLFYSAALDKNRLKAVFHPNGALRSDGLDVIWLELDPRRFSTSGDSLPDGWKVQYGLDPFDDGVIGDYNLHTGKVITNTNNGPNGDPTGDGISNQQKYINGDNPNVAGTPTPPAAGQIAIGPVPGNSVTYGAVTNDNAFSGWTGKDLIALDYYDGGGVNYQGEDVYDAYDGYDSSRDLIAFYAHDGGSVAQGGDGNFYFRTDFEDLQPYAEGTYMNVYVAINFGNPGTGEYDLPDNLRTGTKMGWQAVVACYQGNQGNVYLWNPNSPTHTTGIGQLNNNANLSTYGITVRSQTSVDSNGKPNGFENAYFASPKSACEFSISRQALIDAGWDGLNASKLTYEVFTTKAGTYPGGAGDLGNRSNIRDTFYDDWIASSYYSDQANIDGAKSVLDQWAGLQARNDNGKKVKVVMLIHGNEAIEPGSYMQSLINTGAGAGLYRPLDVHQAYNVPLTMHITPTMASAIQWASASASAPSYKDGPSLNKRIASMVSNGQIDLISSTFSDHILNYFGNDFNSNNVALANKFLQGIYGQAPSSSLFWLPEQVASDSVLGKVQSLGFPYTFIDQTQHIFDWFGRTSSLDDDSYRINSINGMKVFVINDNLGQYLFQSTDGGPSALLRQTLNDKARDSEQDQVIVFETSWESFATKANADAYDANVQWMATRPWVQIVTPDQIVNGQIDTSVPPTGAGTAWGNVSRGTGLSLPLTSTLWINHASNGSYDNWYNGSPLYESLLNKQFMTNPTTQVPTPFGLNTSSGIAQSSWQSVLGLSGTNPNLSTLAQATIHASMFETGFHTEENTDTQQFSTGAFVSPSTNYETIANLAGWAQSQTRFSSIYARVDTWANQAATGAYDNQAQAQSVDIDQDGVPEYLLYNDRVFAEFKGIGGRMVNAWVRDVVSGDVFQALGNPIGYSGSLDEEEGQLNLDVTSTLGTPAYRTSGFKDLFAQTGGAGVGTNMYVNNIFTAAPAASGVGWTFTSSDGLITKTFTLGTGSSLVNASYTVSPSINQLFVRFGLSPNLNDLLINGQANLTTASNSTSGEYSVIDQTPARSVRSFVKYGGTGYTGTLNATAVDQSGGFSTVNMRNQAQTQQVEVAGSGTINLAVGFETNWTDTLTTDTDGIPDWWRLKYFGHTTGQASDQSRAGDDPAGDGLTNTQKYLLELNPTQAEPGAALATSVTHNAAQLPIVTFPTLPDRLYTIFFSPTLGPSAHWVQAGTPIIGTGSTAQWTDDGSQTGSSPTTVSSRFYQVRITVQ